MTDKRYALYRGEERVSVKLLSPTPDQQEYLRRISEEVDAYDRDAPLFPDRLKHKGVRR